MKHCSIEGCDKRHKAFGYCVMHYLRYKKNGDPLITKRTNHGLCNTSEHTSWAAMLTRCRNPNQSSYKNYGGRGIKVCERWKIFENFYKDMGEKPTPEYTLERKDVNGNYTPENCVWATRSQQNRNRRILPKNTLGYTGVTKTSSKSNPWRAALTVNYKRVNLGVYPTIEDAHQAYKAAVDKLQ